MFFRWTSRSPRCFYFQIMAFTSLAYCVAWAPYAIVTSLYMLRVEHVPLWLSLGAPLFAKCSTCFNPLMYYMALGKSRIVEDTVQHSRGMGTFQQPAIEVEREEEEQQEEEEKEGNEKKG